MKSVCRHRNAGVCSTSTCFATSGTSCLGVHVGEHRHAAASSSPWPGSRGPSPCPGRGTTCRGCGWPCRRSDLKMNGMPSAAVISFSLPGDVHLQLLAFDHARAGDEEERLVEPDFESAELHDSTSTANAGTHSSSAPAGMSSCAAVQYAFRRFAPTADDLQPRLRHALAVLLQRRLHVGDEERMPRARRRGEFRVVLAAEEPRMVARARPSRSGSRLCVRALIASPAASSRGTYWLFTS